MLAGWGGWGWVFTIITCFDSFNQINVDFKDEGLNFCYGHGFPILSYSFLDFLKFVTFFYLFVLTETHSFGYHRNIMQRK